MADFLRILNILLAFTAAVIQLWVFVTRPHPQATRRQEIDGAGARYFYLTLLINNGYGGIESLTQHAPSGLRIYFNSVTLIGLVVYLARIGMDQRRTRNKQ